MESYKKSVASNDKVEMIHVSADRSAEAALKWAVQAKLPWLTIVPEKVKSTGLREYTGNYVPDYALVDKDGKKLAKGKAEVFAKIKELTK